MPADSCIEPQTIWMQPDGMTFWLYVRDEKGRAICLGRHASFLPVRDERDYYTCKHAATRTVNKQTQCILCGALL